MNSNIWETPHHFSYNTPGEVTAEALANNLLGLEGVFASSSKIVGRLLGTSIRETEIIIQEIELGSYRDTFLFRMVFGQGDDAEKKVEELREKLRIHNMSAKMIVGVAVTAAVLYGAIQYGAATGKPLEPSVQISIDNSFNGIAHELNLSREELLALLDSALKGDEELKKSVIKLVKPEETTRPGEIVIDRTPTLTISEQVTGLVPGKYEKPKPTEVSEREEDVQLVVRAVDLDKKTGWWAVMPLESDRRIKVELSPEVAPTSIPVGKFMRADIEILFRVDPKGEKSAQKITILKVRG